ncbi:hypothetical protein [Fodinicola feengrottensis]|uniref:hypothetical protein n=1 Tax=Fodinicola feengrottensis TaxID=435914 RepID=UPI00244123C0|nr:hypothetical protein [Fodinicola feengrottensis]
MRSACSNCSGSSTRVTSKDDGGRAAPGCRIITGSCREVSPNADRSTTPKASSTVTFPSARPFISAVSSARSSLDGSAESTIMRIPPRSLPCTQRNPGRRTI